MIKRRAILFVALIAASAVLIPALQATAQEFRGRIIGTVVDNTGAVLPGVTVTTTSPALIQPQTTVTEADGTYRLQALPSGVYLVTFELAGFETTKVENVRVLANTTLTVNTTLQVAGLAEAITVTGAAPTVDTSSTRMGTNFTKELLTEIPNARDVWAAMAQAPGITVTGYDVGGSHTGTQTGYMTYGFSGQNSTRIEGLNTAEGSDANMGYFDFGSFEEFQITASGNMGDQDTPGVQMNVITKSGGDAFSGSFYQDYENKRFIGNNVPDSLKVAGGKVDGGYFARTALTRGNPIDHQYDTNGMFGGRVIRGKLWFFASYRRQPQYKVVLGAPELLLSVLKNYTTKFTYQLNQSNQFIFFYNHRTKLQDKRNLSSSVPFSATSYQASTYYPYKGEWLGTLSSRMLLDVIFLGRLYNNFPLRPQPSLTLDPGKSNTFLPGRYDQTAGIYLEGGPYDYYQNYFRHKPQYFVTLSYTQPGWHGSHDFKFGYERRHESYEPFQDQPYNIFYMDNNGLYNTDQVRFYNTTVDPTTLVYMNSVYAQDSWRFNRNLTINAALRMDRYSDGWPEISLNPLGPDIRDVNGNKLAGADVAGVMAAVSAVNPLFYQSRTTPEKWLTKTTDFGPRIGFAYDPQGNGRTSFKAFWGRFFFNSADTFTPNAIPVGEGEMYFKFNDLNGNKVLDGPQELGAFQRTTGGGGTMTVDPNLKRAYGDEISAHFEQELIPGLSGRISYVRKTFGDRWDTVDLARINAFTIPVTVNDPGVSSEGIAASAITWITDMPKGTPESRVFTNVKEDEPIFNTIEVAVNRRFKDKWMLMGSFGNTWSKDFFGMTSSTSSTGAAGNATNAWVWQPNERHFGMEKTTLYNAKIVGQYVLPFDIAVSGSYKLQQGRNYGRTISASLPNYGTETIRVEPVTARRAPNTNILDFRFGKKFNIYKTLRAEGMVDIFNILNAAPVMTFRTTTGARFKEVSALLDPRIFRFGMRIDF